MERVTLVALCREGFEPETGADLLRAAALGGTAIDIASASAGLVVARAAPDPVAWRTALRTCSPVFARNPALGIEAMLSSSDSVPLRPDRVTPLVAAIDRLDHLHGQASPWRSVWVEHPDTNEGKGRSRLARALEARIRASLAASGRLDDRSPLRLHIVLADGGRAFVGTSEAATTRWPLGIPRLSRSRRAPSRSSQKLAEAFVVFLGDDEHTLVRAGQRAVDLGAAPGGWSWVLAQRGLHVIAVDNGPLKGEVANDPLVTHVRGDGFRYRPRGRVDWLTCDIVEQPVRIAELVSGWLADGAARQAIFNLKLPMKKRYEEVRRCESVMQQRLGAAGMRATIVFRQLYHDREEVTGYASLVRESEGAPRRPRRA